MNPADVTPSHIARKMRMHVSEVFDWAMNNERLFRPTEKRGIGKKHRPLDIPYPIPMRGLTLLHRFAQKELPAHACAHGGVFGKSCYTAASRHCGRYAVITRDIEDCYPSITSNAFYEELIALGFRGETAIVLTGLMTVRNRFPQGSPTSTDALNIFLYRRDSEIQVEASNFGGRYTRSADDMVISVNRREAVALAESLLERKIREIGLKVNERKKSDALRRHQRQLVHNIDVNSPRGTTISGIRERNAREAADGYVRGAKAVSFSTLFGLAARRERVHGHYHDVKQAKRGPGRYVAEQLKIGDWIVARKLKSLGLASPQGKWWIVAGARNEPARLARAWENLHPAAERSSRPLQGESPVGS